MFVRKLVSWCVPSRSRYRPAPAVRYGWKPKKDPASAAGCCPCRSSATVRRPCRRRSSSRIQSRTQGSEARADAESPHRAVRRRRVRADERGRVGPSGAAAASERSAAIPAARILRMKPPAAPPSLALSSRELRRAGSDDDNRTKLPRREREVKSRHAWAWAGLLCLVLGVSLSADTLVPAKWRAGARSTDRRARRRRRVRSAARLLWTRACSRRPGRRDAHRVRSERPAGHTISTTAPERQRQQSPGERLVASEWHARADGHRERREAVARHRRRGSRRADRLLRSVGGACGGDRAVRTARTASAIRRATRRGRCRIVRAPR